MAVKKVAKQVQVLTIYRFKNVSRICFEVLSSDNETHYNTCFDGSIEKHSCTCPAGSNGRTCYHVSGLTKKAAEYFASRQPAQPVQAEKPAPVAAAEAFINRVVAEKAAKAEKLARGAALMESGKVSVWGYSGLHNANERAFEAAPSGRMVPMR